MEGTSLYLPIVILLMQCSPSVPVTVKTARHMVEVEEFSDAVLSCQFHTEVDQNPRIEWKKKTKETQEVSFVYFEGRFKGPFEGRATINGATVTLHKVTQEDAGEYRCEISASLDPVTLGETNVTLNVLVPPQTPSCEVPASAVTGSAVQLRCRDQQSVPPATYSWFKDNKPISPPRHANATYLINSHTGILEFKSLAKEDSGRYSCLASNGVGSPKMCVGKHMTIEDVNVTMIVGAVVVVCLLLLVCGCGGMLLHRNGLLTRPRGSGAGHESERSCLIWCAYWLCVSDPTSTTPPHPKNPRISNTHNHSCSEEPPLLQRTVTSPSSSSHMRCQLQIRIFPCFLSPINLLIFQKNPFFFCSFLW
ncbi:junctional adhesion molecule 2A isoform X2 [Cyprinodon tularosa]|uniref:junctional adhesion molecule 2A isoform X2 n=1 Tax=Cyprinodon tularosa TaxID=77115 RepID=UPI0018E232EC|nr:junctional adhesion molecule 2A isoform X2 [Cyprinodon tularosa]